MAQYRMRPEQIATRALRSRLIKQHISKFATPKWADRTKISAIYVEAERRTAKTGIQHVVDHVIPLKHPNVCGLHVQFNLQLLTTQENAKKSNHFVIG